MGEHKLVWGPTYQEMFDPSLLPAAVREAAVRALRSDEWAPVNLFNIGWRDERGRVRAIDLPRELTGVEANIIVLIGRHFPSGSHKAGPAYAAIMEAELDGQITPGNLTLVAASTGNYAIGLAYISRLKGYTSLAVVPEKMSEERYVCLRRNGAVLDPVPESSNDGVRVLRAAHERYGSKPGYRILSQFELFANYRFHRYVTGRSALEAATGFGDGRIAAFVAAPGTAGTLAAGDEIKARFPAAVVVALEPLQCPTLYRGERGAHRVEGIADQMVTLIHNLSNTDYVALIDDEECLRGLRAIQEGPAVLTRILGVPEDAAYSLVGLLGVSGVCNILGAIKTAKALQIPSGQNIVTVATDGFDRYPSAMADLEARAGNVDQATVRLWAAQVFRGVDTGNMLDVRSPQEKERLFRLKEEIWSQLGYSHADLEAMKSQSFWDAEYARVAQYDQRLQEQRGPLLTAEEG